MRFMNEFDIEDAERRFFDSNTPNRHSVAVTVYRLAAWADNNSDGWHSWPKPARAANKAMALIESRTYAENKLQERTDATPAEVRAAISPIKAFLTRMDQRGLLTGNDRAQILQAVSS